MIPSVRLYNCLRGIDGAVEPNRRINMDLLKKMSDKDFLSIPNFGLKSLNELKYFMTLDGVEIFGEDRPTRPSPNKKGKRNEEIYNLRMAGKSYREISKACDVSFQRARQIFVKEQRIRENPYFALSENSKSIASFQ